MLFRSWSGASPEVFQNQTGEWVRLKKSHRLTDQAAQYAKQVLASGGWGDVLSFWSGGASGEETDGTTAYLARTHSLTAHFEADLQNSGTPYLTLRGYSPWSSKSGDAYRALLKLEIEGFVDAGGVKEVVKHLPTGYVPSALTAPLSRMQGPMPWPSDFTLTVQEAKRLLPNAPYFNQVERQYGPQGMFRQPKHFVGTIHAAKGKQWQDVYLADSWAFLPAKKAALSDEGARNEACVAFVGVSRHQRKLELVDGFPGYRYPFP